MDVDSIPESNIPKSSDDEITRYSKNQKQNFINASIELQRMLEIME